MTTPSRPPDQPSTTPEADLPVIVIRGPESSRDFSLREIWQYRELLYFLTWRDIKVRYKQTIFGAGWAVIQPLFLALALNLFLGRLTKIPSDGLPYLLFVYTAMVPWQFFDHCVTQSSNSVVANERLITKVYFPRLVVPLSAILEGLVDLLMAFLVLLVFLSHYRISLTPRVLTLPFFIVLAAAIAFGVGLWLGTLNVQFRDVRYTLGFLLQLWFFATPVAYPMALVPDRWRAWYSLNPMVVVIEGFRWALFGRPQLLETSIAPSLAATAAIVLTGFYYFKRMENTFADII